MQCRVHRLVNSERERRQATLAKLTGGELLLARATGPWEWSAVDKSLLIS